MKYFVARMSFHKSQQKAFEKMETKENPMDLLERLLRENPEYYLIKKESMKRNRVLHFFLAILYLK